MKVHTTNYYNTFIAVADDCPVMAAEIPPQKPNARTIANIQFEMINKHPYKFTSDDVVFECFAEKNEISVGDRKSARETFFSKGQPCVRSSPLTKRYGWGVHSDNKGHVALLGMDSPEYKKMISDKKIEHTKGMRSKRV